jgi:hypothetical protein
MAPTQKDAFVSLWAIQQAQEAALRRSPDNGLILLAWGGTCFLGLASFDVLPPEIAGFTIGTLAFLCACWQYFYKRSLPVQPAKLKLNRIVWLWSVYHVGLVLGGTAAIKCLFSYQPPFAFTFVGLLDAAPLLINGWVAWRRSRIEIGSSLSGDNYDSKKR